MKVCMCMCMCGCVWMFMFTNIESLCLCPIRRFIAWATRIIIRILLTSTELHSNYN